MLHLETVDAGTLGLLKWLQGHPVFAETRLVGGTALALQLGHRKSIDLDVFGHLSVEALELEQTLREYGPVSVAGRSRMIQAYFDDADEDPMPNMLMPCDWGRMKRGIVRSVAQIGLAG